MQVLLVSILKGSHRNLSCLSLFSFLSGKGVPVELLFIPREGEYRSEELAKLLRAYSFDLVGVSVLTDGFHFAERRCPRPRSSSAGSTPRSAPRRRSSRPTTCASARASTRCGSS